MTSGFIPLYLITTTINMDYSGKQKLLSELQIRAIELRTWLIENSSPDVKIKEWCDVANQYAILCTRMYIIEKN